jgi:tetratricopeptide (TPR) repeat protein
MRSLQRALAFVGRHHKSLLLLLVLVALLADLASHWGSYFLAEYRLHAARKALDRQDYGRAQELLMQHLRYRPESAEGHFLSARLARRSGDVNEAARQLQVCQKLGSLPRDILHLEQALLDVQQGNLEQEKYLFDCLARQHPDSFLILEALSQGYTKRYQLTPALDCLNRMLEVQPDNAYARTRRGWIHERFNNHKDALADYRHAVSVAPDHLLARRFLADLLLHVLRKPDEAAEHYEFLEQRQPDDPALVASLAQCWLDQDKVAEARSLVGKALLAHPRDANLLLVRGLLAHKEGQAAQAETWLRQAIAAKPSMQPAYYTLILVLEQQGKSAEVEKCQEQLRNVEAELKQMDALVQRVVREPTNPQLRFEIAQLLVKFGEDQEADNWLRMVLLMDPYHQAARQALTEHQQRAMRNTPSPFGPDPRSVSAGLTPP